MNSRIFNFLIITILVSITPIDTFAGLGILQGYTTATEAQFSILHTKGLKPLIFVRGFESTKNFRIKNVDVSVVERPDSNMAIPKVRVSNLSKQHDYILEVWTSDKFRKLDSRKFRTLDLTSTKVRILAASCMSLDPKFNQEQMWAEALSQKPDLIVLHGDSVYVHHSTSIIRPVSAQVIWEEYVKARQTIDLYKAEQLIPILGAWDDGDYGTKDGDSSFRFKRDAKATFEAFFAQEPDAKNLIEGPGISRFFKGFGLNFFLMDARSFRNPSNPNDPESHWGTEQEEWLLKNLKSHPGPTFIIEGPQFFGGYHKFESFERQTPNRFLAVMSSLKQEKGPIMFISGDRHLAELIGLSGKDWPYETFEFTTSSIHAKTYPGSLKEFPNPRQLVGKDGTQNYGVLDISTSKNAAHISVAAYGPKKRILFKREFRPKGREK